MKKNFLRWLTVFLFLVNSSFIIAQNEKGQIILSGGVGYSPEFNGEISILSDQDFPTEQANNQSGDTYGFGCTSIVPNIGLTADYAVLDKLSLGFALSYQTELVNWSNNYSPNAIDNWIDRITRINIATRILLHLNKHNRTFDPYVGLRPGICYWIDNPQNNEVIFSYSSVPFQRYSNFLYSTNYFQFSMQVLYGMRVYISDNAAINFEFAIGQPFLLEGGISFRFHAKNKTQDTPAPINYGGHPTK